MQSISYRTERLDHLGIVAGICDEIDLIGQIDRQVPKPRRQVSVGEAVQAMVLNALGFVGRPLYLTPEFFANKLVEVLIRSGIRAEMLNDDSLGRALDALWEAGLTEVFAQVAAHALTHFGLWSRFVHVDTSSFHVHGAYEAWGDPHHPRGLARPSSGPEAGRRRSVDHLSRGVAPLDSGAGRECQRYPKRAHVGASLYGPVAGRRDKAFHRGR